MTRKLITSDNTILVGVTGGIASGKSTVSRQLAAAGLAVVDADQVARQVVEPGTSGLQQVVNTFGSGVLLPNGKLDRHGLGRRIFNDDGKRRQLNQILQPIIRGAIGDEVNQLRREGQRIIVLDLPLLFETGYAKDCDRILVVTIKPDLQLQRLMARNGYSQEEAQARIDAQFPLTAKAARADYVINNNGDRQALKKAVEAFLTTLPIKEPHPN